MKSNLEKTKLYFEGLPSDKKPRFRKPNLEEIEHYYMAGLVVVSIVVVLVFCWSFVNFLSFFYGQV